MSADPYIPFYTSDFLGGTSGMTASCKGVYITLLCLIYETEGPLTQKWDILARRCGCTLPAFKHAVSELEDDGKLEVSEAGIWSPKCEKHITQRRERQSSARSAAETRWKKNKQKQGKADATAMRGQCQPEPEPDPYRETNVSLTRESDFDAFWAIVPRRVGRGAAEKAFAKARKAASFSAIMDGMRRYASQREGQDHQYTCHPATWLNQKRWLDEENQSQSQFHDEVERMMRCENGIPGENKIDLGSRERLSAPIPEADASGHRGSVERNPSDCRGGQQPHFSIVKPRRFGGKG